MSYLTQKTEAKIRPAAPKTTHTEIITAEVDTNREEDRVNTKDEKWCLKFNHFQSFINSSVYLHHTKAV